MHKNLTHGREAPRTLQILTEVYVEGRLVRSSGFEPPRYCYRQPLKLVRLPVPPRPHSGAGRTCSPRKQGWKQPKKSSDPLVSPRTSRRRAIWSLAAEPAPEAQLAMPVAPA